MLDEFKKQVRIALLLKQAEKLEDVNRPRQALKKYSELLKLDSKNIEAWKSKGDILYDLGRNLNFLSAYTEGLKLNPNDYELLSDIALSYHELEEYEKSLNYYNQAVKIDSSDVDVWFSKADTEFHLQK